MRSHRLCVHSLVPRRATATRSSSRRPTTAGGAPRVCALSRCVVAQFVLSFVFEGYRQSIVLSFCESSSTSVARLHPPPARMRRTARPPYRSRQTARSRCLASTLDGDGDVDVLSASRSDDTVAWYVYLVRGCGHRHEERKIPIRLGMSERQKDGDECIRAMVENRRENTRRTPAGRSLSLAHQVREPLRELLRGDARAGPVADARADPGADAGSDNAPADAARELATRRLLRRRRRAGGSCSTSRSRRTRRRRSMRPSRPRACSCRATGCGSRADLARAGLSPRFFSLWGFR